MEASILPLNQLNVLCYNKGMNLTLLVKLQPDAEQLAALLETMERFNAACNAIAEVAFHNL